MVVNYSGHSGPSTIIYHFEFCKFQYLCSPCVNSQNCRYKNNFLIRDVSGMTYIIVTLFMFNSNSFNRLTY